MKSSKKHLILLKRLADCSYFLKGSISDFCANCNRSRCTCKLMTEKRSFRLTYKDQNQKTKVIYVPRHRLPDAKKLLANHSKLKQTIVQLLELNIKMFKDSS